jgi:hypothetical protein
MIISRQMILRPQLGPLPESIKGRNYSTGTLESATSTKLKALGRSAFSFRVTTVSLI